MPLIIMTGMPCTGKTTRSKEIKEYFEQECQKSIVLISENDIILSKGMDKNKLHLDFQKEKELRSILKSEALKHLERENVVILDAANYIKGFRYELYCVAKSMKTNQCTVECVARKETVSEWNFFRSDDEKYTNEAIDALVLRFEPPDSRNRWDSPLVTLMPDDKLNGGEIFAHLFHRKPPTPNMSTQSLPSPGTSYLYELDKVTQEIVSEILEARRSGVEGKGVGLKVYTKFKINDMPPDLTPAQMARYKRQFLNYAKMHPPLTNDNNADNVAQLFTNFLNSIFVGSATTS